MTILQHQSLSIGSEILSGTHYFHGRNGRALVYVHGFGGHRGGEKSVALANACQAAEVDFVAFDFRSHGQSSGHMRDLTASRLLDDLKAVQEYLQAKGIRRVGVVGSSMGGFASGWWAVQQPAFVAGCVLLAPAFRFLQRRWEGLTPNERELWRTRGTWPVRNQWLDTEMGYGLVAERDQYRPEELARRWQTPTIIYHGLHDDIVPARDSLAFVEGTTYPHIELRLLKAGDHRLTDFKDSIAQTAVEFLAACLSEDRDKSTPTE